jgi:predicted nucleic acid-binding protein
LPDGIIAATSLFLNVPLITADKNFKKIKNLDITLYQD